MTGNDTKGDSCSADISTHTVCLHGMKRFRAYGNRPGFCLQRRQVQEKTNSLSKKDLKKCLLHTELQHFVTWNEFSLLPAAIASRSISCDVSRNKFKKVQKFASGGQKLLDNGQIRSDNSLGTKKYKLSSSAAGSVEGSPLLLCLICKHNAQNLARTCDIKSVAKQIIKL